MFRKPTTRDLRLAAKALHARGLDGLEAARIYAGAVADRLLAKVLMRSATKDPRRSTLTRPTLEYVILEDLARATRNVKHRGHRRRHR